MSLLLSPPSLDEIYKPGFLNKRIVAVRAAHKSAGVSFHPATLGAALGLLIELETTERTLHRRISRKVRI
jgi:hypothetical protein